MELGNAVSMSTLLELLYISLKEGARKSGQILDITDVEILCDKMDETPGAIEKFGEIMESSLKILYPSEDVEKNPKPLLDK